MSNIKRVSIKVKGIAPNELESALSVLLRSFEVQSIIIRKHGRS